MPQFRYTTPAGLIKTLEAPNERDALALLPTIEDAAPTSGVMRVPAPVEAPEVPEPISTVNTDGSTDPTKLRMGGQNAMPEPTAPGAAEMFQGGLEGSVLGAQTSLTQKMDAEKEAALKRTEELYARLEEIQKEVDPTRRATFAQEEQTVRNQLQAAETASATLERDFDKRRSVVSELEKLLTEGNRLIESSRTLPVSMSVLNKSASRSLQDVQARAGVLQAVVAGLDGNMSQARSLISGATSAVSALWRDKVEYNRAYLALVERGGLAKNKIHQDFANAEIKLAERKLADIEETKNYIQKLMINPESAQFLASAGVSLNDSIEEINTKMAEQARTDEIDEVINDLKLEGYQYVPFADGRTDTVSLDVGGQTLYFIPPASVLEDWAGKGASGGGSGFTATQRNKLEQAGLLNASRQEQLDFLFGSSGDGSEFDLATQYVSENIENMSEEQLKADLLRDSSLTVTEINAIIAAAKKGTSGSSGLPSAEEIRTKVTSVLERSRDTLGRGEAKTLAQKQLKKSLGIKETEKLPSSYEKAIEDSLVEVYGATFWQNLFPGGRGKW